MTVGLLDVDGHNFPNLAQMKLSAHHKARGDNVERWDGLKRYDIVYQSKVFTEDYTPDIDVIVRADKVITGGTGCDLKNKLPDEVEHTYPDYGLYPQFTATYGFLTRGCPRDCKFCIVAKKEGRCSEQVASLSEFWREQREIKLLDPNLLACRDHEDLLQQLAQSGAWVDFTQGLDIRLITRDNAALLNRIKTKILHFAWDNPEDDLTGHFERFNKLTSCKDERKKSVYVLTNFSSTHEQDLYRIYTLCAMGFDPYVMIYKKSTAPRNTRLLQRWCNNKRIFRLEPDFTKYDPRKG